MNTRIEIFKDGIWKELILAQEGEVKYNAVINKIGSISGRDLKHTNTFSLPYIHQNINALGINVFNKTELTKAFNSKYVARYFVKDKLFQSGFLLINNTDQGEINVNFIDEALEIVEKWGTTNYFQLLNADLAETPQIYKDAILEMTDYIMSKTSVLPQLTNIVGKTYPIAKYPNSLNAIGDKFQIDKDGLRIGDAFNPYQSRPIFNIKALFDIAIESYGYIPYYDNSINWERLEQTYMIDKDLFQGQNDSQGRDFTEVSNVQNLPRYANQNEDGVIASYYVFPFTGSSRALRPNQTPNWNHPNSWSGVPFGYENIQCLMTPRFNPPVFNGEYIFTCRIISESLSQPILKIVASYVKQVPATGGGFENIYTTKILNPIEDKSDLSKLDFTVSQSDFQTPPSGFETYSYHSVAVSIRLTHNNFLQPTLFDCKLVETSLVRGAITYDAFDQYEPLNVNLTHAAPRDTIKNILSAIMDREGILISFDNKIKTVKLFSYASYSNRKLEGNFSDWTKYHLKYISPLYNTDYGDSYAKNNEVGLSSPFKGNTAIYQLTNQGEDSKYKDFTQNFSKLFKDVESVNYIGNPTKPYFEYKNTGLGLVEFTGVIENLTQSSANGNTQGTIPILPLISNVNGIIVPSGLQDLYKIVDESIRSEASFLLPVDIVKNVELAEPIFIESLGGFYIIEEVAEYVDSETIVRVKLIKLTITPNEIIELGYNFQDDSDYIFQENSDYDFNN
jgi:hypothetical protein